jgi:hypothetical protein
MGQQEGGEGANGLGEEVGGTARRQRMDAEIPEEQA